MNSSNTILFIAQTIKELLPGSQVYLFGSRVKKSADTESDYDILIIPPQQLDVSEKLKFKSLLRKIFALKKVDADLIIENKSDAESFRNLPGHIVRYAFNEGKML